MEKSLKGCAEVSLRVNPQGVHGGVRERRPARFEVRR